MCFFIRGFTPTLRLGIKHLVKLGRYFLDIVDHARTI